MTETSSQFVNTIMEKFLINYSNYNLNIMFIGDNYANQVKGT